MTSERNKKNVTQNATKQEIGAALKLIGLLYEQGEIPKHAYRNICNEYYGKGLDKGADARYTIPNTEDTLEEFNRVQEIMESKRLKNPANKTGRKEKGKKPVSDVWCRLLVFANTDGLYLI